MQRCGSSCGIGCAELHDRLGLTTIFVTHDQGEALELADRVAILNAGVIEQVGPPREVYDRPDSAFVTEFLGEVNKLPCRVTGGRVLLGSLGPNIAADGLADGEALAYVRPHEIELPLTPAVGSMNAIVRSLSVIGPRTRLHIEWAGNILKVDADRATVDVLGLAPGRPVRARFKTVRLFSTQGAGCATLSRPDLMAAPRGLLAFG